jgi:hypothetical protein
MSATRKADASRVITAQENNERPRQGNTNPHSEFRIPHSAFRIPHSEFRIRSFRPEKSASSLLVKSDAFAFTLPAL